jgi:hypothetical protein
MADRGAGAPLEAVFGQIPERNLFAGWSEPESTAAPMRSSPPYVRGSIQRRALLQSDFLPPISGAYLALLQDRDSLDELLPRMSMSCCLYAGDADDVYDQTRSANERIPCAELSLLPGSPCQAFMGAVFKIGQARQVPPGIASTEDRAGSVGGRDLGDRLEIGHETDPVDMPQTPPPPRGARLQPRT